MFSSGALRGPTLFEMETSMYQLSLIISSLLAQTFRHVPTIVEKEVIKEVEVRDPAGIMRNDILFIQKHMAPPQWTAGTTIEEVAYAQGQLDLLKFIEDKVVGRRVDRPSS